MREPWKSEADRRFIELYEGVREKLMNRVREGKTVIYPEIDDVIRERKKMPPLDGSGEQTVEPKTVRTFDSGATRSSELGRPDFEGYLSPLVWQRFGAYMAKNQKQKDGSLRASDNWQKGMPFTSYLKSAFRHFMEVWSIHRGGGSREALEEALCALLFNIQGYLHEHLKERPEGLPFPGWVSSRAKSAPVSGPQHPSEESDWYFRERNAR